LDVPLPIPVAPTDPAPPLSVPLQGVTEEAVATAFGYAAQVVHLLSTYMNIGLTYPVTCIGSRSLIKDSISAMVGPRMFPLFSKAVDTYRFEYAVFLLNKDIELLMSDRDLRAMDMRHTLPNLKNLLLTLTDPESSTNFLRPPSALSFDSNSLLQSPVAAAASIAEEPSEVATVAEEPSTPGKDNSSTEQDAISTGSTTPTRASSAGSMRKSRAFLNLSPLTGFLRVRYPSSSRNASGPSEAEAAAEQGVVAEEREGTGEADEEDDRRTIRDGKEGNSADDERAAEKVIAKAAAVLGVGSVS